ncbi:MAG: 50S ribosomal protein L15 [Deltaproteobacteria bacterium]|nr:MAG: 50S ribosomal protein L15 [Deltaproteobacteria bacterium]
MQLHDLGAPKGANKRRKRVGRGESSGWGKTAGRGGKGQTARTGKGKPGLGFEGGQMPMYRRMPKRGFVNIFAVPTAEINVGLVAAHFGKDAQVDLQALVGKGLARKSAKRLRVLGMGEVAHPLRITADHFAGSARTKLEAAGGVATALVAKPPSGRLSRKS